MAKEEMLDRLIEWCDENGWKNVLVVCPEGEVLELRGDSNRLLLRVNEIEEVGEGYIETGTAEFHLEPDGSMEFRPLGLTPPEEYALGPQ
ncbi:hypothetical protein AKJ65_03965 [candidate division MSBL1 archaeon SCGC-AAA259E19]|uniref:Uncharacterized protein n=2 Tax=candidate division MSBL1 TaxID=215777 RepID=A0A133ULF7_9EURY|nr:hypothetical protein AKJ65_03965 [candidate division MSBL1 archaeon SCGC-AAA259E19]KXA95058.1 hypothetical protein AKJ36_01585 [candidate division MSBL1 archaeon SCGC-AAA259I07]